MKIIGDLHTHTNVSQHALSTFEEMLSSAVKKGHKALAITNHTAGIGDGANKWHFGIFRYTPKIIDGVAIIGGAEANILVDGSIDIESHIEDLDYIIASMHEQVFKSHDSDIIENAYLNVLKNKYVNTLGHIGNPRYKFNYENIISKCNEYGKIIEINSGSFNSRKGSFENCRDIIKLCKKYSVPIALTSDAHTSYAVGEVDKSIELALEIEFPQELIINASVENLQEYFIKYRGFDIFNR